MRHPLGVALICVRLIPALLLVAPAWPEDMAREPVPPAATPSIQARDAASDHAPIVQPPAQVVAGLLRLGRASSPAVPQPATAAAEKPQAAMSADEPTGFDWKQHLPPTHPSTRYGHSMAYDSARGVTVLFGGWTDGRVSDTWEWDGTNWLNRNPASHPLGQWTAMAYDSTRGVSVLFGGDCGPGCYSDETWEWDGMTWVNRSPETHPLARHAPAVAYDRARGVTVLFGGYPGGYVLSDTWEWDGTSWLERSPVSHPLARYWHSMAFDSVRQETILFGGFDDSNSLDDTWVYGPPLQAPILSPIDNPDGDGDYLIAWSTVEQATTYRLEEDDDISFPSPTVRYLGGQTSFQVSGQGKGDWFYRVKVSNAGGDSYWSNIELAGVRPGVPTLYPIENGDGDGAYLVDWTDETGATAYELEEDDNPSFTSPALRYAGAASQYDASGQQLGTWHYRVRASNTGGASPWSNAESVVVDKVPPVAPTLYPISNPDGNGDYLVDWSEVAEASSYLLVEDNNPGFTSPAVRYTGASTQYDVTGQQGGSWYYRVQASNEFGDSPWSNTESVGVIPEAPLLSPINNPDWDGHYLVDWNDVIGAAGYTLQEDDNPGFDSAASRYEGMDTEFEVTGQPDGTWYYRVRAETPFGPGPWSNPQSVTVDDTAPSSAATSPSYDNAQPIPVDWTATDPAPSLGLCQTCLWYKLGQGGTWTLTAGCQSGASGTFSFEPPEGTNGTYHFQTIAEDCAGNIEPGPCGDGDDSTVFDTVPPASEASSPTHSVLGEIIPVTWQASDTLSGLLATCLWYSFAESGSWTPTGSCEPGPSGTFFFRPIEGAGTYRFQSTAADNAGNIELGPADPGDTETQVRVFLYLPLALKQYFWPPIANGDFETGDFTNWAHGGDLPQIVSTFEPHAGTYSALLGTETPPQEHPKSSAWVMQQLTIPSRCVPAVLSFWYRIYANDVYNWASFRATMRDSVGSDHEILRDGYPGPVVPPPGMDAGWRNFTVDLDAYSGQTIELRFENKNEYDGALGIWTYVDDVRVTCGY